MIKDYENRGYPLPLLHKHKKSAERRDHKTLVAQTGKQQKLDNGRIPIVLTYNPGLPDIIGTIRKHWPMLQKSERIKDLFDKYPILAYRRSKNLRDILVKAKLKPPREISTPLNRNRGICTDTNCEYCRILDQNTVITNHKTGQTITARTDVCCKTTNLIYILICPTCNKQYIGETKRDFQVRYKEHVRTITKNEKQVGKHFNLPNHTNTQKPWAKILQVFTGNPETDTKIRKNSEQKWIHTMRTFTPWGMNKKE